MSITLVGDTGVDAPGFTQGGDPVVESGSNSDGAWTRWADGTQICRGSTTLQMATIHQTGADAAGVWFSAGETLDYPLPFVGTPTQSLGLDTTSGNVAWPATDSILSSTDTGNLRVTGSGSNVQAKVTYVTAGYWR